MTEKYRGMGFELAYPENWKLTEDDSDDSGRSISIESPDSAFFTVTEFPGRLEPFEVIEQAIEAMRAEYESIEVEIVDMEFEELEVDCVELSFYYLDLFITARMIAFNHNDRTLMVQQQAENRDFDRLLPVFDAMLTSLIQSLPEEELPGYKWYDIPTDDPY